MTQLELEFEDKDCQARRAIEERLDQSMLVEASAGTGKNKLPSWKNGTFCWPGDDA